MNNIRFETDLAKYLPEWYRKVIDYNVILDAEKTQLDAAKADVLTVYGNLFFSTMDVSAIAEWEKIFSIIADPSETLDFRRARVLNRVSMKPPYTIRFLEQRLDELIGPGKYSVNVDAQNFILTVETAASDQSFALEVAYTINHIKPAHIVYINVPVMYSTVLIGEVVEAITTEWNYRLGSWVLGFDSFIGGSESEVIKMASVSSIQPLLINALSAEVLAQADSVLVNGSIALAITKSQSGGTATIEYTISNTQTDLITNIQLLDSNSAPLTSVDLYVPVTEVTTLRHIFTIEEGTNG